jgi:hypothetical protein
VTSTGRWGFHDLARLWVQAGGPVSIAGLMAAIALAESNGDPNAVNPESGATGFWQIHPGGAQYKDPLTNARTAVAKYRSQGLGAWEAYTNGAYKRYLPASGGGGGVGGVLASAAGDAGGAISGAGHAISGAAGGAGHAISGLAGGALHGVEGAITNAADFAITGLLKIVLDALVLGLAAALFYNGIRRLSGDRLPSPTRVATTAAAAAE